MSGTVGRAGASAGLDEDGAGDVEGDDAVKMAESGNGLA